MRDVFVSVKEQIIIIIIIIIIIKKMRDQRTRKTWSQGTPVNSHIGHCTHNSESTNLKI
jgi:hypothetical protein